LLGYGSESLYVSYAFQKTHGGSATAVLPNAPVSTFQALSAYVAATPQLRLYGDLIRSDAGDPKIAGAHTVVLAASWISGASEFRVAAARRRVDDSPRGQTLWLAGYDYNLSKRTALYTRILRLQNRSGAAATVAGLPIDAAGGNGTSLGVGIRHSF
jgi:predicted porin